jgi:hypothetical protein
VVAQRFIAALLTLLLFALVYAIFVSIFSAAHHTGLGWLIATLFCLLMAFGGWRASKSQR